MKKFFSEFKTFISRGNVMDMAVGVIVGGAFTAIVNSLVTDIISPILGLFGNSNLAELAVQIGGVNFTYGNFISAVINFLLTAFVLFCVIKAINSASEKAAKLAHKEEKKEEAPKTKTCPYCKSEINIEATRCPHCTSVIGE